MTPEEPTATDASSERVAGPALPHVADRSPVGIAARPILGPLLIGLFAVALFHGLVAFSQPKYWTTGSVWDETYYVGIARSGYQLPDGDFTRHTGLAFSPGWPLLLRAVSSMAGTHAQYMRAPVSAVLFVLGCVLLGYALRGFSRDHLRNNATVLLFALWPGSLYFRSGYAETLYFPLLALFFGLLLRKRYTLAALAAAACCFTRTPAVILIATLAFAVVYDAFTALPARAALRRSALQLLWLMPISALGLAGYMAMIHSACGDPLAFSKAYAAWARCEVHWTRSLELATVIDALVLFERPTVKLSVIAFLLTPVVVWIQRRRIPMVLCVFTAIAWLFFLSQDWLQDPFHDMLRWMSVVFPMHYAIVLTFDGWPRPLRIAGYVIWILCSVAASIWCSLLFIHSEWVS